MFLDYAVAAQGGDRSGTTEVRGYATDGAARADFHIEMGGASDDSGSAFALALGLTVEPGGLDLATVIHAASSTSSEDGHVEQTLRLGTDVFQMTATRSGGEIHAAVAVNGRPLATIEGAPADPEIRGADGQPLSPDRP